MNTPVTSVASRVRRLKARRLGPSAYLRELTRLADLDEKSQSIGYAFQVAGLRDRIAILEQRVRKLEAHK